MSLLVYSRHAGVGDFRVQAVMLKQWSPDIAAPAARQAEFDVGPPGSGLEQ